jgi:hypothetical protein
MLLRTMLAEVETAGESANERGTRFGRPSTCAATARCEDDGVSIYVGRVVIDDSIAAKIREKHSITPEEVREALEWPAQVRAAEEWHEYHGHRWVALGRTATDREVLAVLLPTPDWEDARADTWVLKTARWL